MAAGGRVGTAARGARGIAIEMPDEVAAATPKPGGGVVNTAAGAVVPEDGHPGMLGALTFCGSWAEMPLRTETI